MSYRGFDPVIGIEIHVQLNTESKIFSSDSTSFHAGDNENTSPVSIGMPGTLPVLNKKAVDFAIKTGLALDCKINENSVFSRKNYFYPDLPKGYQISQFDKPICEHGSLVFNVNGIEKKVNIVRAHLEEDAGKSTHFGDFTLLNYNRAGVPLLEIVSGPDLYSAVEAAEYARNIRQIVRYLGVCDGNLEEGSLRCDCNVSVKKSGVKDLGTRVEIKNINSFRFIEKAIEYEIDRQIDVIENGGQIIQETRLWDPDKNKTFSMRTKEDSQDYRYFPDPDLLPISLSLEEIQKFKSELPELPILRAKRFQVSHGLPEADATILTSEKEYADFYEASAKVSKNYKATANWIMTELIRELNANHKHINECLIKPEQLGFLVKLIDQNVISGKIAKLVFIEMWNTGKSAEQIVKEKNLVQLTDEVEIEKIVDEVLNNLPSQVTEYKNGNNKLLGFFVGELMKKTKGQVNPSIANKILNIKLNGK